MTKRTEGMTNKEWLEQVKKFDEISEFRSDDSSNPYAFRQAKATEIIAEELIKLNSRYTDAKKIYHLEDLVRELDIKYATLLSEVRGDND